MYVKPKSLNKIFINKILFATTIKIIVLCLIFLIVKDMFKNEQLKSISEDLLITDSYTSEEIIRYKLLDNVHALELALYNLEDTRELNSAKFILHLNNVNMKSCISYGKDDFKICRARDGTFIGISPLKMQNQLFGYILTEKKYNLIYLSTLNHEFMLMFFTLIGGFIFNLFFVFLGIKKKISTNTDRLIKIISEDGYSQASFGKLEIKEYTNIALTFIQTRDQIATLQNQKILAAAAAQLVHDIRSPLAALNTGLKLVQQVPEELRILMRNAANRINDIANNLLLQYKGVNLGSQITRKVWLLAPLVESILSEKRLALDTLPASIEADISHVGFAAFADFDTNEMKRVLSNLINNSLESLRDVRHGKVNISLDVKDNYIFLDINDNGNGISDEFLEKIWEPGFTLKVNGNGLGLSHAKKMIESWGGNIRLSSSLSLGTRVSIVLPQAKVPPWFVSNIEVSTHKCIAIVDDDQTVHDAWDQRLLSVSKALRIQHFMSTQDFMAWYPQQILSHIQVISDYELLDESLTGLDVLEKLNVGINAVLMTSHYENTEIIERCQKSGIRLLPKNMLSYVPIDVSERSNASYIKTYDAVLIDDEPYNHEFWIYAAKRTQKRLMCVFDMAGFETIAADLTQVTPVYIDLNLGNGVRGLDIAKLLYDRGFRMLYIVTGYVDFEPADYPFLAGVGEKVPPF